VVINGLQILKSAITLKSLFPNRNKVKKFMLNIFNAMHLNACLSFGAEDRKNNENKYISLINKHINQFHVKKYT
jgi:hypothetical protein